MQCGWLSNDDDWEFRSVEFFRKGINVKLLYCNDCFDVRKLQRERTECKCGESWGQYEEDGLHAKYGGPGAVLLGLSNHSLIYNLILLSGFDPPKDLDLDAWVIQDSSDRIERIGESEIAEKMAEKMDSEREVAANILEELAKFKERE